MVMRKCPKCGSVWYSSDTITDWKCDKCGEIIPKELSKNPAEVKADVYESK